MFELLLFSMVLLRITVEVVDGWLPEGVFPRCDINDKQVKDCIIESIYSFREYVQKEGLIGLSVNPFILEAPNKIKIENTLIHFEGNTTMLTVFGLTGFRIDDFSVDTNDQSGNLTLFYPKIDVLADYNGILTFIFVPLESAGRFYATLRDTTAKIKFKAKKICKDDSDYIILKSVQVELAVGPESSVSLQPTQRSTMGTVTTTLINLIPVQTLMKILKPGFEDNAAQFIKFHIGTILEIVPLQRVIEFKKEEIKKS